MRPEQGLDPEEVRRRLERSGPNRIPQAPPVSPWVVFFDQLRSGLVLLLVGAAALAAAIGDFLDASVILVVVGINAVLGFVQEYRAERAISALRAFVPERARVRRGGRLAVVEATELVPGDVVALESGDRVPADGRLLESHRLEVDESGITGESSAVVKRAGVKVAEGAPLADRINLGFMNTVVTRGRGLLLVTATGRDTQMGRMATLMEEAGEGPTPLQVQLGHLGHRIATVAGAAIVVVVALGLLAGRDRVETVLTAISLAVAAIPEGLPAVVAVTLAVGMHRMARSRAIVKRMAAAETLGCATLICSDKTGTLTLNQMTARAAVYCGCRFAVDGAGYSAEGEIVPEEGSADVPPLEDLLLPLALCNDARVSDGQVVGDATEAALIVLAAKAGLDVEEAAPRWPRVAEVPFDPQRRFMATFHRGGTGVRLFVKGAPDVLLEHSTFVAGPEGPVPLDAALREELARENATLAARGLRVIAAAERHLEDGATGDEEALLDQVRDLTFLGLVGIMDPPRPEVREALDLCRQAGIAVKMITGDQKATAEAIARELGLEGDVIESGELDWTDEERLGERLGPIGVFARLAPEHKVALVRVAQARGHVVAMTGDGANDAPALRHADIGIAMGRGGTDVTRQAATLVLTDDNFATIVGAVRQGRTVYENIGKFVRFQLSTNFGAIFSVFSAPLLGLPIPFNPIQILWVNIIMDGPPALALGLDPPRPDVMSDPPRGRSKRLLSLPGLARLAGFGAVMTASTLGVLAWALDRGPTGWALSLAFTTFVWCQLFNALNVRSQTSSAFGRQIFTNGQLWAALVGVFGLQLLATSWEPARRVFHAEALSPGDWALAAAAASPILLLEELRKLATRLLRARRPLASDPAAP